jgi:hypothetical protein
LEVWGQRRGEKGQREREREGRGRAHTLSHSSPQSCNDFKIFFGTFPWVPERRFSRYEENICWQGIAFGVRPTLAIRISLARIIFFAGIGIARLAVGLVGFGSSQRRSSGVEIHISTASPPTVCCTDCLQEKGSGSTLESLAWEKKKSRNLSDDLFSLEDLAHKHRQCLRVAAGGYSRRECQRWNSKEIIIATKRLTMDPLAKTELTLTRRKYNSYLVYWKEWAPIVPPSPSLTMGR